MTCQNVGWKRHLLQANHLERYKVAREQTERSSSDRCKLILFSKRTAHQGQSLRSSRNGTLVKTADDTIVSNPNLADVHPGRVPQDVHPRSNGKWNAMKNPLTG